MRMKLIIWNSRLQLNKKIITRAILFFILATMPVFFLPGCSVYKIQESESFSSSETWLMLPFLNHSDTPEAGKRAADIAATLMRSKGISQVVENYTLDNSNVLSDLDQQKKLQEAITWGQQKKYRYGISGSVQEWRYKSGLDSEPAVGVTLKVIDLNNAKVLWSASGSKTGWGRDSVSGAGHELMQVLIDALPLSKYKNN
jgi:TolB-like protein